MLHHVSLLEVHAIVDGSKFIVDLVKLVHELIGLPLLVLLVTTLLLLNPILQPLLLLLEVFDLYLFLEQQNFLLLAETMDQNFAFGKGTTLIRIS